MAKYNPTADKSLAALKVMNEELATSTIPDAKIKSWAKRLAAIVSQAKDFEARWMANPPVRDNEHMEKWLVEWSEMSAEMQRVWTESYTAATTEGDFLKLNLGLWADPLEAAEHSLLNLLQLPCQLKTVAYRLPPTNKPRASALDQYAPAVRSAIEAAEKRQPVEPVEDK